MRVWGRLLAWAGLMVVLGLLPLLIGWSNLPDPVAIHWGLGGEPDNAWPKAAVALLPIGMVLIGLLTTSLFRVEGRPTAEAVAMVGLMGGVAVSLMLSLVFLNWDAPRWEEAAAFGWWHILGVLIGGAAGAWIGYLLGIRWYPRPAIPDPMTGPTVDIAPGESVAWTGEVSVIWPLFLVGGVGLIFLTMPGWWKLLALVFIVLAFLFMHVYVLVDNEGLEVRLGGRIPAKRIALEKIKSAQAIDLEPSQWAGWGYRVVPGGSAVVLRRGDAIQVNLNSERKFAVTVDDAATGAALLSGLVARMEREAG